MTKCVNEDYNYFYGGPKNSLQHVFRKETQQEELKVNNIVNI